MTNDAKLGLLAGVAGVLTAALYQRPAPEPPAAPVQAAVSPRPASPPRVAGAVPPPRAVAPPRRPEVEARPVSRVADDDE